MRPEIPKRGPNGAPPSLPPAILDNVVEIERKALDLIDYLIRQRARMVSKAELLDALWPDTAVTESSLTTCIAKARTALGDRGSTIIKSYYGRGYRFMPECGPVPDATGDASPGAGAATSEAPFFGRVAECAALEQALQRARTGRGQLVLLEGEQGVGKTRLLEQVRRSAQSADMMTLVGRCRAPGGDEASAAAQIVRQLGETIDRSLLRSLPFQGEQSALTSFTATSAGSPLPTSPEALFHLFDDIASLLRLQGDSGGTLLIAEDLQWADSTTLLLLHFLARDLSRLPVLLVGDYRPEEPVAHSSVRDSLARLSIVPEGQQLTLRPFADSETTALIRSTAGDAFSDAVVRWIAASSEGNPWLIQTLTQHLASTLPTLGGTDDERRFQEIGLPPEMQAWAEQRVNRVAPECQRLLEMAAVIGRDFDVRLLARLTAADTGQLLAECVSSVLTLLEQAVAARLVTEIPAAPECYRFSHGLIHTAIFQRSERQRRER